MRTDTVSNVLIDPQFFAELFAAALVSPDPAIKRLAQRYTVSAFQRSLVENGADGPLALVMATALGGFLEDAAPPGPDPVPVVEAEVVREDGLVGTGVNALGERIRP